MDEQLGFDTDIVAAELNGLRGQAVQIAAPVTLDDDDDDDDSSDDGRVYFTKDGVSIAIPSIPLNHRLTS